MEGWVQQWLERWRTAAKTWLDLHSGLTALGVLLGCVMVID